MNDMRNFILYFTGLIVWWSTSCEDPNKDVDFKVYEEEPIATWLAGQPEYSDWVKMLKKVDLYNALNLMTEYTCFVADNSVVAAYLKANTSYTSVDEIPAADVDFLMRYHIIPGKKITSGNLLLKIASPTASGFYLTAGVYPLSGVRYIDNGSGREKSVIIQKDIALMNGVVHKLDVMLQPITESVWDLVAENSAYTIFHQALAECGLQQWLDSRENHLGDYSYVDEKTILVVSDSVFNQNGVNDLEGLKSLYPGNGADTTSAFWRYMAYHILNSSSGYAELTDFPEGTKAMNIYPYAPVTAISIVDSANQILLNPHTGNPVHIIDSRRDIPANNGYIHEVDGLMPIPDFMARNTVVWEPTGRPEFKIIPFYRSENATSARADTFGIKPGMIPGIRWESIPAKAAKVYYQSQNVDDGRFLYNDALVAELGKIGWIELDFPILPKGKYNIKAVKSKSKGGGKYTLSLDVPQAPGSTTGSGEKDFGGGNATPDFGTYDFTSEEVHSIRFTVGSTVGFWMIDRFIFTPVN